MVIKVDAERTVKDKANGKVTSYASAITPPGFVMTPFAVDKYGYLEKRAHGLIYDLAAHGEERFKYLANSTYDKGIYIQAVYQRVPITLQRGITQMMIFLNNKHTGRRRAVLQDLNDDVLNQRRQINFE